MVLWRVGDGAVKRPRQDGVAQIFNLPYRRFSIGRALAPPEAAVIVSGQQNAILRYGRLKICATTMNIRANLPSVGSIDFTDAPPVVARQRFYRAIESQ
jgi:hypothetical protein